MNGTHPSIWERVSDSSAFANLKRRQERVLAWLVSHAATLGQVLTTAQNVPYQPISAEQAVIRGRRERVVCRSGGRPAWAFQAGLDQRPASTDPVAIATIDEFVRPTGKATLWSVLARREPEYDSRNIEVPTVTGKVSMQSSSCRGFNGRASMSEERHTLRQLDVGNRGSRGIQERRRRTHRVLPPLALQTRLPRTFDLETEERDQNRTGPNEVGDGWAGLGVNLHRRTHSPRPLNNSV